MQLITDHTGRKCRPRRKYVIHMWYFWSTLLYTPNQPGLLPYPLAILPYLTTLLPGPHPDHRETDHRIITIGVICHGVDLCDEG